MSEKIRVGVVGTSGYADFMHLPSLSSHPQAEIVAICGRNQERANELAQKYHIPHVFSDYRTMIAQAPLDALVVAVPDDLHNSVASAALEANLHVLCEKPLALNAQDAWGLYQQANERQRIHLVHFTYRWRPWYRYVQRLVSEGYIGKVYDCELRCLGNYGRAGTYAWRFDGARGHGILADLGSHMIDLSRWFCGEIEGVSAQLSVSRERPGADGGTLTPANDSALLSLRFASGTTGMIHVSAMSYLGDRGMEKHVLLHGEKGTLEVFERGFAWELWGGNETSGKIERLEVPADYWGEVEPDKHLEVFVKQSAGGRAFIDAIIAGKLPEPNFFDGAKVQDVLDAALLSAREQRTVEV